MKKTISLRSFMDYSCGRKKIELKPSDIRRVKESRSVVERLMRQQTIYGVNTGIGPFFEEKIEDADWGAFQRKLILSHAAGTGPALSRDMARGVMFLLINMLLKGHSGISLETLQVLIELFNNDIIPAIPEQGSVGASGDLAPLAHLAAVLIGEGDILLFGAAVPVKYAFDFERGKIKPVELKPGEALALINGTHFMASILAHAVWHADILCKTADISAAITFVVLGGNPAVFSEVFHRLRPHPGHKISAAAIKSLLADSCYDHRFLQDAYSLRCIPQVHGAVIESVDCARKTIEREINSVTGNPIYIAGELVHGGNFHGQSLSQAADFLGIGLTTLGNIAERRVERLLNYKLSGLPPFLSEKPGLDSGLMIAQYTAAALLSENKTLSHPASVDSIPLAGSQEDFVSMGPWAARTAWQICKNTSHIIAIELLCASLASNYVRSSVPPVVNKIQKIICSMTARRGHVLAKDIERVREFIWSGEFLDEVDEIKKTLGKMSNGSLKPNKEEVDG